MKTIFTLLALCLTALFFSVKAQVNEGFENTGGLTHYHANGWNFYGASFDYTSKMTEAGSIYVIPSTSTVNNGHSNSNTTQIISPFVNFTSGGKISFNYKLAVALGGNQDRTFHIRLYDGSFVTNLFSFTINGTTQAGIMHSSPTVSVPAGTGSRRIIIDFEGRGDGNSYMYFDNLSLLPNNNALATTLPIKLLSFSGIVKDNKALLKWNVDANETGNYFEIQKSYDGKTFKTIQLLFVNEVIGVADYNTYDALATSAYYRLHIINKDHSTAYSNVIYLKMQSSNENVSIRMLENPIINQLRFQLASITSAPNKVTLYNLSGVSVYTTTVFAQKGTITVSLPIDNALPKGNYILEVSSTAQKSAITITK